MPIGTVSDNFYDVIDRMTNDLQEAGDAPEEITQRPWMTPDLNGYDGDPLNIGGMAAAFDTTDLNNAYATATQQAGAPGRVVDRMVAKIQVDYLAAMERAYRARHATIVRCQMHAAGRRQGQGGEHGVLRTVRSYINELVTQGGAS